MARVLLTTADPTANPALDIALSERNLIVLLSKLYTPHSACSFANSDVPSGFDHAVFRAEPDDLHYAFPTRDGAPPGPMHPLAEFICATVKAWLAEEVPLGSSSVTPVWPDDLGPSTARAREYALRPHCGESRYALLPDADAYPAQAPRLQRRDDGRAG